MKSVPLWAGAAAALAATAVVVAALALSPVVAGPRPGEASGDEGSDASALRERLEETKDRQEWNRLAHELLTALDAGGEGDGSEARWLIGRLLEHDPDDPLLIWRRAEMRRRIPDDRGAIDDLERLIETHPGHELATRARRALPALYLKIGMPARAARADETLLELELAEPVAVLRRLARTYAALDQPRSVATTIDRMSALAPDEPRYDPELAWLRADSARRLGTPAVAAEAMLEFANLFPRDARRAEALLAAARASAETGRPAVAAALAGEAAETGDGRIVIEARLLRGTLLESAGKSDDARRVYAELLEQAIEPEQAALAVQRLIDIEVEERGSEAALVMLAGMAAEGDRFTRPIARGQFARLLGSMSATLARDPGRAAFYVAMSDGISIEPGAIPEILLAAASVDESTGAERTAARRYRRARSMAADDARTREKATLGVARTDPEGAPSAPSAAPEVFVARLEALERRGERAKILEIVEEAEALGELGDAWGVRARVIAARAATTDADPERAVRLLGSAPVDEPEQKIVLADALALLRRWPEACPAYREAAAALAAEPEHPMAAWSVVRVAACDVREADSVSATDRLNALIAANPPEPARLAAINLLEQIATTAGDPQAAQSSDVRPEPPQRASSPDDDLIAEVSAPPESRSSSRPAARRAAQDTKEPIPDVTPVRAEARDSASSIDGGARSGASGTSATSGTGSAPGVDGTSVRGDDDARSDASTGASEDDPGDGRAKPRLEGERESAIDPIPERDLSPAPGLEPGPVIERPARPDVQGEPADAGTGDRGSSHRGAPGRIASGPGGAAARIETLPAEFAAKPAPLDLRLAVPSTAIPKEKGDDGDPDAARATGASKDDTGDDGESAP